MTPLAVRTSCLQRDLTRGEKLSVPPVRGNPEGMFWIKWLIRPISAPSVVALSWNAAAIDTIPTRGGTHALDSIVPIARCLMISTCSTYRTRSYDEANEVALALGGVVSVALAQGGHGHAHLHLQVALSVELLCEWSVVLFHCSDSMGRKRRKIQFL